MARYEAAVMNGANGSVEIIHLENTYALGGCYCYETTAKTSYERGNIVARVYDSKLNKTFWLNNIDW